MVEFYTKEYEMEKLAVQSVITDQFRASLISTGGCELEAFRQMGVGMAVRLTKMIVTEKLDPIVIRYPTTWLDAFKVRFLKGWHANYTTHTIEPYALFPEYFPPELGKAYRHVRCHIKRDSSEVDCTEG